MAYYATNGTHRNTSPYGWRTLLGKRNFHKGRDYVSEATKLAQYSPHPEKGSAIIKFAGWDRSGGGNMTWWKFKDTTGGYYLHSSQIYVKTGQIVAPTEIYGLEGATGNVIGRHTHHVELSNGDDLSSHHNFTLEVRGTNPMPPALSDFDKLILRDRPDVQTNWVDKGLGTPTEWWNLNYAVWLLIQGSRRHEPLLQQRLVEATIVGDLPGYLRDLYQYYWQYEYENTWDLDTKKLK